MISVLRDFRKLIVKAQPSHVACFLMYTIGTFLGNSI